jgi:hypothetical protein
MIKGERLQGATTLVRKVLTCLMLQPSDHSIDSFETLREDFLCATNRRLVNLQVKWLLGAQAASLARENEVRGEANHDNQVNEFGLRSFSPFSVTDTE